jgi:S-adenosylhomocysteine hydrolase
MTTLSAQQANLTAHNKFLRELPLLDFTSTLYPEISLHNALIICAQHLVSTSYSLFCSLFKLGLNPNQLAAIGKCYSTDPLAYSEMKKLGIDVCPSSLAFNSHLSFDEQYQKNIKKFIRRRRHQLTDPKYSKIIVLDDGGELITAINSALGQNDKVIGIEQTSSGFHKLKHKKIGFPIINVARSPAKLNYESPIIARLVVGTLVRRIKELASKPRKILIIGNGSIGAQIEEKLKPHYHVVIFDRVASRSSIDPKEFETSLNRFDLIIGCTGKPVLTPQQYKLLKKPAILVSASSSDREFNAVNLRTRLPKVKNCHQNLFVDDICLINCGFPINFDAEFREIDSDDLQLTRALLLAAILQAHCHSDHTVKGFIPLDIENQREIVQKYLKMFVNEHLEFQRIEL